MGDAPPRIFEDRRNNEVNCIDQTEAEELQNLEADVNQMAQTILHFRTSLPDQLKKTLASLLAAQRPVLPLESASVPGPSKDPSTDAGGKFNSGRGSVEIKDEQENGDKLQLLRHKISDNQAAMATVLKRVKDCISNIEKLESSNGIIHPAFKRKRTS